MDTQEHEYELGTLEEDILDRDESHARQSGTRGDERRWMILGGAGTLALMSAIAVAVSLGGSGEPHQLSASLPGPVRDLAALSAHLQSAAAVADSETAAPPSAAPKTRIARHSGKAAAPQPTAPQPLATLTAPASAKPTSVPTSGFAPDRANHAAVADTSASTFANLPTVSSLPSEDAGQADQLDPEAVVPTNFEQDDDPFAEDSADAEPVESGAEEDSPADEPADESEPAQDDAAAPTPEAEPAPTADVNPPAEAPAPTDPPTNDVAASDAVPAPTPA